MQLHVELSVLSMFLSETGWSERDDCCRVLHFAVDAVW